MASPAKLPPSLENATPEQLKKLLVGSLQKLKNGDKQIEELTAKIAQAESVAPQAPAVNESNEAELRVKNEEIEALRAKLQANEVAFAQRMEAETELLNNQIRESDGKIVQLEQQLQQQTAITDTLNGQLAERDQAINTLEQQVLTERQQNIDTIAKHEKRIKDLESSLAKAEEEATSAATVVTPTAAPTVVEQQPVVDDGKIKELESKLDSAEKKLQDAEASIKQGNTQAQETITSLTAAISTVKQEASKKQGELEAELKSLQEIKSKLEQELVNQKESVVQASAAASSSSDVSAKEVEAAKAEVVQIRKETDIERARVKKAMLEMKKRVDNLQKERQRLEEALETEQSKLTGELDALKASTAEHEQRALAAQQKAEQAEAELRDYKARAHTLLKAKETQIKDAQGAAREELAESLAQAQVEAAQAKEAQQLALAELAQVKTVLQEQLSGMQSKQAESSAKLMTELSAAKEAADAAKRQYDHLQLRYDSIETRAQQLQSQVADMQEQVTAAVNAKKEAEELAQEQVSLRQAATDAAQNRATELARLAETNSSLRAEIDVIKNKLEQASSKSSNGAAGIDTTVDTYELTRGASLVSNTTASLLTPASSLSLNIPLEDASTTLKALADKDKQLQSALKRATELERELDELERENTLRQAQEQALKEAVRDLEREKERMKLPEKQVDMEYFKNVMLKLFETGQEESLLPVVATVLQFSPAELSRCKKAVHERSELMAEVEKSNEGGGVVASYFGNWIG